MRRRNLRVLTHAHAKAILLEGRTATGISFDWNGVDTIAHARGELILASGTIGTPQLLELSGIGRGNHLQSLGVATKLDLPGVGENLQDHLQVRLTYKVQNALTRDQLASTLYGKASIALQYAVWRRGPMAMAPSQLGAFAKSDTSQATPNLQYHAQPLTLDRFGEPLHAHPAITASVANLRPDSRGHAHAKSPDYRTHPSIRLNYLAAPRDRKVAVDAIRLIRRIMATQAFAPYRPEEVLPGTALQAEDELEQAAGRIASTIFHPVGTARMGNDGMAVVDDRLRVRGISGLRVIDASVMPTITSGNTAAPTMMIAEKGAAMIAEDRRA